MLSQLSAIITLQQKCETKTIFISKTDLSPTQGNVTEDANVLPCTPRALSTLEKKRHLVKTNKS